MKIQNSLWLILLLLWGMSMQAFVPKNIKPLKEKTASVAAVAAAAAQTAIHTTAQAVVPRVAEPKPASLSAKARTKTGTITSLTFRQFYPASEISLSAASFFGAYTYQGARLPVQTFDITFTSQDHDGTPVAIHAQVFVPSLEQTAELPVYVFASGTTGIGDLCAPSLEQPTKRRWGWYHENMLAYASLGYLVIFPDYTGFNDASRPQRYFSKYAEGHMMLDAIRAILQFPNRPEVTGIKVRPGRAVFAAGYSQGGHAAFAAADLHTEYAPEVPLTGVITYGGTNDVEALMREGIAYGPLILYSYMMMYGREAINPADYLLPDWLPTFEHDASTLSVDIFQRYYGFDGKRLYTPNFLRALNQGSLTEDYPDLARLLSENHTGFSGHKLPALIVQGNEDFIVTNKTQTNFVTRLQLLGSEVQHYTYPHVSHRDTRAAGFETSVTWMEAKSLELGIKLPSLPD